MRHAHSASKRAGLLAAVLGAVLGTLGCGAKTGLRVPDVSEDVVEDAADGFDAADAQDAQDVVDVPDVDAFEACVPGRFPLRPREAEVVFLIDRSRSMMQGLYGSDEPPLDATRWAVLGAALEIALPPFQTMLTMGAVFFPGPVGLMDPAVLQCRVNASLTVVPARSNAAAITRVLRETDPGGGTPTFAALDVVRRYYAANPDRARARYMVLATDGGPNCNGALDRFSCVCTSLEMDGTPNCPTFDDGAFNCLDDGRTLASLRTSTAAGVPTYVIGIDDPRRPDLTSVLDRMAVAGGRPAMTGATRYYSVRRPTDLAGAFASIQRDIVQCAFVTPSRPDDPDAISVEINGATVPRDLTHTQGWDWTDRSFGELTFFGAACDRAAASPAGVSARVGCDE